MNVEATNRQRHWDSIYAAKVAADLPWFQADPTLSMSLVRQVAGGNSSVVDVGAGASLLVDRLLDARLGPVAALDVSAEALQQARQRLGPRADEVRWIVADVTAVTDIGRFDIWHDRAVFHFLTAPEDRSRYRRLAALTVPPGGHLIVASFALDGPRRCSGLEVCRYDAQALADEFCPEFRLLARAEESHVTPTGRSQPFVYAVLRRE